MSVGLLQFWVVGFVFFRSPDHLQQSAMGRDEPNTGTQNMSQKLQSLKNEVRSPWG